MDLAIVLLRMATSPQVSADVCWGHPARQVEAEASPCPVDLNEESVDALADRRPALASALKDALRRGHPSSES